MFICVGICVFVNARTCPCMFMHMCVHVYMHVRAYVHACICVCIYMYGYVHVCLEIFQNFQALQSLTHKLKRMSKVIQALGSPFLEFCG